MAFTVNPPLPRMLGALPAALGDAKATDRRTLGLIPQNRHEYSAGTHFCDDNPVIASTYLRRGRIPVILVFGSVGVLTCSIWASGRVHFASGTFAALLWAFSPYMLSHGAIISADIPAAAVGVAAVFCFWTWLKANAWDAAFLAGVVLGLAELCKFTLLVFYPMFVVVWVLYRLPEWRKMAWREWLRQGGQLAVMFVISAYVINCGYLFEGTFTRLEDFKFQTMMFTGCDSLDDVPPGGGNRFAGTWMGKIPVPLPANMVQGIDTQRLDFERGVPSYVRGQWANHGWWYYYLYALLVKMPLGTWGLFVLAIVCSIFLKGYNAPWRDEMVVLLPLITLFVFVSSQTGFSVHSRYVIPALPFLFIWISKVGRAFTAEQYKRSPRSTVVVRGLTVFFLGWMIVSSMAVYPHSLSYFNELAAVLPTPYDDTYPTPIESTSPYAKEKDNGLLTRVHYALTIGPRYGPRHLLDSNIDWGQDLFYLEDWYEDHPEARPFHVAYWGSYPLELSKIKSAGCPPTGPDAENANRHSQSAEDLGPQPGWYALSVNEIYSRNKQYRYFLHFEPVDMAGYSIYIYHITLEDANRVRRKLGLAEWVDTEKAP